MPYCPNGLTEYQDGVTECIDCHIPLVEGTPQFCPRCEEQVYDGDTFCDHCGILLPVSDEENLPECEKHPDRAAVGGCIVCGRPVCSECANEVEGKYFCDDDSHLNVHQDYVVAFSTALEYEADMIKANLDGAGIEALVFNQHDHVYFVNVGSLALVNVMVPK